ncbi:LOB domain-containing protein 25-like [Wolffia australiana]
MATSNTSYSPCAACKFLRRKCIAGCIFAPYFPPEEPQKFSNVHKIFGASNVTKLLNDLLPQQREDAVNSLAYEAEARIKDPVYGCVGAISVLQRQVQRLQKELDAANAELLRYAFNDVPPAQHTAAAMTHHGIELRRVIANGGSSFFPIAGLPISFPAAWAGAAMSSDLVERQRGESQI